VGAAFLAGTLFSSVASSAEGVANDASPASAVEEVVSLEQSATLLNDLNEIKRLQRIYGYYLDRSSWDEIVNLLTDDATAEYGASGVYVGKASIRKLLYAIGYNQAGLPKGLLREHMQFQPVVDVAPDGRTAKGRWRVFALLGKYGEYARWQAGPYENEYRKEGGVWKISKIRWYETFTVPFDGAWKTQLTRANLADRTMPSPDRPSTSTPAPWPAVSLPPYHYSAGDAGRPCCVLAGAAVAPSLKRVNSADLGQHLASLRASVQRAEDERDVEILQRSYGYYVDKNRWDQVTDLFVEDGTLEIGGRGVFVGKKRIRQYLEWLGKPVDGRLYDHTQLQPVVNVSADGKTAKGRWRALIFTGDLTGSVLGDAIYENEYRKEGGKWKIATLRAYFIMYTTLDRGGWDKFAMPNTRPEKELPPDQPPRLVYDMYPGELTAPNHFANPVAGKPVAGERARDIRDVRAVPSAQALTAELASLRQRLGLLADVQAIERLQNAYGYYIDKWQWDDAASLFAENATYEVGQQGVYSGRAHIRRGFELMGAQGLHQNEVNDRIQYQPVIHVAADGLTAKARTRQLDVLGKFGGEALLGGGVHENEYVKVNGVWKISKLHLYTTFLADLGKGGWAHGAIPAPARSEKLSPDAPPTEVYSAFPKFFVPAYHYGNPVTEGVAR
jgi:hypothetical protein